MTKLKPSRKVSTCDWVFQFGKPTADLHKPEEFPESVTIMVTDRGFIAAALQIFEGNQYVKIVPIEGKHTAAVVRLIWNSRLGTGPHLYFVNGTIKGFCPEKVGMLTNIHFVNCSFPKADFSHLDLNGCSFDYCNLTDADFRGCVMRSVRFLNCQVAGMNCRPKLATGVSFPGSDTKDLLANEKIVLSA